ncbi:hypothetical protein RSSM_02383 [Rhodopirellula sallentina SM41]|uniref:Uncharacterized protein n=1 Tax=Rhodopirellula sallentina SM41 TaxID=1263870 RepID=M5UEA7_9BACT|nr:hypothetical protein RSSM_02383 [Rhodopirellula sallentina SM41]
MTVAAENENGRDGALRGGASVASIRMWRPGVIAEKGKSNEKTPRRNISGTGLCVVFVSLSANSV